MFKPLLEKYKPKLYSDIISQQKIVNIFKSYTDRKDFPNCILYGTAGIGKTSMIEVAINELYNQYKSLPIDTHEKNCNVLWINASEERGIKVLDETINSFIKHTTLVNDNFKIIIFDECDNLTVKAQLMIKNYINSMFNIRYCFICNDINKIKGSIVSKCVNLKFTKCNFVDIFDKIKYICQQENILISDKAIRKIIKLQDNDIRAVLNNLQYYSLLYYNQIIFEYNIKNIEPYNIEETMLNLNIEDPDYYKKIKLLFYIEKYYKINKNHPIIKTMIEKYFN